MEFQVRIPFVEHLGFVLQHWVDGEAEITFDPAPEHLNSFNVVHGGASMTLLDVVMAHAARSVQQDMGVVTIEMKTSFMQAAKGPQRARGRLLHRTTTLAFTEGQVFDADGRLCAHATGTFKYVKRLPVNARGVHELNVSAAGIATD
ncbi:hotdog fold thioesterase [Tepidicella baoligensis]|uniref:hotdog fold thioesterase n=1 Tax=Tepidicella baoligensis TaxID=2707016 RepID=UPI0015DA15FD